MTIPLSLPGTQHVFVEGMASYAITVNAAGNLLQGGLFLLVFQDMGASEESADLETQTLCV